MAAPPNDLFADAQIISGESGSVTGTTFDALHEGAEPSIIGTNDQSVWYKFTPPTDGVYKFSVPKSGATYHGTFGFNNSYMCLTLLPDGTLTQMTITAAISDTRGRIRTDDVTVGDAVVIGSLAAGSAYYIRCSSIRDSSILNSGTCDFTLLWEKINPPDNDNFVDATVITSVPTSLPSQTNFDATFEVGNEVKDNGFSNYDREQSVWYKFTPPATGRYRIGIPVSSIVGAGHGWRTNVTLQISTGTTLATYQAGEIGTAGWTEELSTNLTDVVMYVDLTAATDYYIRAYSRYANKSDDQAFNEDVLEFTLEVEAISPPANDNYASATVLNPAGGTLTAETTRDATEEASEPSLPYTREQSVWYSFTPATTGKYRFLIPLDSLAYAGYAGVGNGELSMSLAPDAGIANHTQANALPDAFYSFGLIYPESGWQNPANPVRVATLTASQAYMLKITSNGGSSFDAFNTEVVDFDLLWELITPPSNDDFANAATLTGSSGQQDFSALGSTAEVGEPHAYYWDDDGTGQHYQQGGTVWFKWTAPSTGWFKFTVEMRDFGPANYDIAIYTGTTLGGLTRINNAWAGSHPGAINDKRMTTTVGFQATSGQEYKIQVAAWSHEGGDAARISWATLTTPVGDLTTSAVTGEFSGRTDNYGNTDDELPPNYVTLLSAHSEWWYNDGLGGKSKWFKYTAPDDVTVQIKGRAWADSPQQVSVRGDIGLIAYKGANYAGLTVAQSLNPQTSTLENVAMLEENGPFFQSVFYPGGVLTTVGGDPNPTVALTAGETLWVCLIGLYDNDINGDASVAGLPVDAAEFDIDLTFNIAPPPNDNISDVTFGSVYGSPTYAFNLAKSHWGNYLPYSQHLGGQIAATTFGATSQAGEPAHAGYGPTRSVWFLGQLSRVGDWKFWVESTVDCVLSIYEPDNTPDVTALTLIDDDDDSGAGNWPEIIFNTTTLKDIWVCVDSKTPGNFVLKWEWVNPGPAPTNDNFDNATVVPFPGIATGTTIGAGGEYFEWDSEGLGSGVTDTVWFKFTANQTKTIKIEGRILSNNNDGYVWFDAYTGADKDNLTRVGNPDYGGGIFRGPLFPTSTNDPLMLDVVNGQDYYIRVYTESGGSEDFEIWIDTDSIYLDLQPGGFDVSNLESATIPLKLTPGGSEFKQGPFLDAGTVPLKLTPSGVDDMPNTDSGTVPLKFTVSGTDTKQLEAPDAATIYLKLTPSGEEQLEHACFTGEGNPDVRWLGGDIDERWTTNNMTPDVRWFCHIHKGAQYC